MRIEYYRDSTVALEAFKAGQSDIRSENIAKNWATAYDFPAVRDGRVIKGEFPHKLPTGLQGYAMNTRRPVFADPLVRQAIATVFDFEWTNKNLFFGLYDRTKSFFELSPLMADGMPAPEELTLLEPYRAKLHPDVFGEPIMPPVSDGSGQDRKLLREASRLLDEAGWKTDGTLRKNAKGETLDVEFLIDSPIFERIMGPYVKNLKLIGINASYRGGDEWRPLWRRHAEFLAALLLPPLALLGVLALHARVGQYGFTGPRIIAMASMLLFIAYALTYAGAALISLGGGRWMERIERINLPMAFVIMSLCVTLASPFGDPVRLAVANQNWRMLHGRIAPEAFDYAYLRRFGLKFGRAVLEGAR